MNGLTIASLGDEAADTGPIDVVSFDLGDPGAGFTTETTLHTESTWTFQPLGDRIYALYLDPQGGIGNPENGQYAVRDAAGSWTVKTNVTTPYAVHIYAGPFVTSEGTWLFGESESPDGATAWLSTDDEATWAASLTVAAQISGAAPQFFGAVQFGDELIAVVGQFPLGPRTFLRSGGAWTEIAGIGAELSDAVLFSYNGTPYWLARDVGKQDGRANIGSTIHAWVAPADDAQQAAIQATLPDVPACAVQVSADGQNAYIMTPDGKLFRGTTAGVWTEVLRWNHTIYKTCSLTVDDASGYLGVGTTDSKVYRTPIPT